MIIYERCEMKMWWQWYSCVVRSVHDGTERIHQNRLEWSPAWCCCCHGNTSVCLLLCCCRPLKLLILSYHRLQHSILVHIHRHMKAFIFFSMAGWGITVFLNICSLLGHLLLYPLMQGQIFECSHTDTQDVPCTAQKRQHKTLNRNYFSPKDILCWFISFTWCKQRLSEP